MSISMLSAPSAFKPTLVSDYFFNEPPSPLPHSFTHDVHLSSSPELESPTGAGSNHAVHAGFKKSEIAATIPEEEQHHDAGDAEEDVVMEITTEAEHVPSPSRAPHPSNDARDVSMTDVSTAKSSEAESSTSARTAAVVPCEQVSAHCARIHQNLMNAAMAVVPPTKSQAPHPQQQPQQQVPPPPMQPQERKYSASTTSTMVSAPSTAPNSHGNSPVSPCSDAAMSTSVSASGTPSPPPLRLPQAAQAAMAMNLPPALMPADQQSQPQQQQQHQNLTPKPSPPRSVPSAVSQLTPVAVPPHTTPAKESSSTYHQANTQHAQTPHQPSRREHHHHHHHSTHSNPTTPPTHTRAHHHSNAVVPASQPSTSSSSSSAAAALASRTPENVEYVGPFILGPVLGRGCTGTVRLGTHKRTGFECAFKIIEKKTLASNTDGTHSALWAKVKREIAILKLIEHKHVLKLYDVLETENRLYLVLEKSERGELFDYIVSKGRLDRHESLRITAQIIMGLEHCHSFSICHRDLKRGCTGTNALVQLTRA
jgi:hypothetical protein